MIDPSSLRARLSVVAMLALSCRRDPPRPVATVDASARLDASARPDAAVRADVPAPTDAPIDVADGPSIYLMASGIEMIRPGQSVRLRVYRRGGPDVDVTAQAQRGQRRQTRAEAHRRDHQQPRGDLRRHLEDLPRLGEREGARVTVDVDRLAQALLRRSKNRLVRELIDEGGARAGVEARRRDVRQQRARHSHRVRRRRLAEQPQEAQLAVVRERVAALGLDRRRAERGELIEPPPRAGDELGVGRGGRRRDGREDAAARRLDRGVALAARAQVELVVARAGTVCNLLPGAALTLRLRRPDARALIAAGCTVALGTDCNPGSSLCESQALMMSLGVLEHGLYVDEAWRAVTRHAAQAIGVADVGSLVPGSIADFVIWQTADHREVPQHLGTNLVGSVHFADGRRR